MIGWHHTGRPVPACGWAVCGQSWRHPAPPPVYYKVVDGRLKCVDCRREEEDG